MNKDEIQKVTLGTNEALRVTAEGEFIWHPEADAMIEYGDFTSSPAMRHILRALRKALAASVQKGAIGAEYQKSPWDGKGISMPPPEAPVQDSTCSETLRAQGKAYPRTCKKCGLGPCIALANAALDKMAENARELGLDYEPHKGLSEHLAQATNGRVRIDPVTGDVGIGTPAAPVQEPVAWTVSGKITDWSKDFSAYQTKHYTRPVYTPPAAKRQWVGLTVEEIADEFYKFEAASAWYQFAHAIEAKLKEKNT
jgi:hypothetical protein